MDDVVKNSLIVTNLTENSPVHKCKPISLVRLQQTVGASEARSPVIKSMGHGFPRRDRGRGRENSMISADVVYKNQEYN